MSKNATPDGQTESFVMPAGSDCTQLASAGLRRRLLSMLYESLLLLALLMLAGFVYLPIFGTIHGPFQKAIFQLYLVCVMMVYFTAFWLRGGQTLAMKTWRIRLVETHGKPLTTPICLLRFVLALTGLLCFGLGFVWALLDRDRQFLHDRLVGTRIVRVP